MKIQIGRFGNNILCNKDYTDIDDKGEIAQVLIELELIKKDLLELWEEANEKS